MLVHVKDVVVPAVSPPAVKVTVNTPPLTAAVAAGLPDMPVKPPTTMAADDENPVSVTTTLARAAIVVVGMNWTVAVAVCAATAFERVTLKDPKLGVTAGRDPMVVVSKLALAVPVAAAILFSAACGALGLMMLVTVKDAAWRAVRVPAEKVTVNTPPARVGAAVAAPLVMPVISPTTMAAVDVNPVSVTTTLLKLVPVVPVVGVNAMVTFPLLLVAADAGAAEAKATLKDPKLGVIATSVATAVMSRIMAEAIVAAAMVVDKACGALGLMMLEHVNIAGVPAVRVPAVKVTVNTLDVRVAVAAGLLPMPLTAATAMVAVEVNPVSVTTTLLKPVTATGVNVMVNFPVFVAAADANDTAKDEKAVVEGHVAIASSAPTVVESKGVEDAKVAALIALVIAACGTLGSTTLFTTKDATVPGVSVPAVVKVTVKTPAAIAAVATGEPPMPPLKEPT